MDDSYWVEMAMLKDKLIVFAADVKRQVSELEEKFDFDEALNLKNKLEEISQDNKISYGPYTGYVLYNENWLKQMIEKLSELIMFNK